jgi:hypothetical protein
MSSMIGSSYYDIWPTILPRDYHWVLTMTFSFLASLIPELTKQSNTFDDKAV